MFPHAIPSLQELANRPPSSLFNASFSESRRSAVHLALPQQSIIAQ